MKKFRFFAALCCTAVALAACDQKNEPTNDGQNNNGTGMANGHGYVDLGLSVKWATCNMGAVAPEAYGGYYAWGETAAKADYSWETYKYGTLSNLTKYNASDGKTALDPEDDAAIQNWGGAWRMPTNDEWQELIDNCEWAWTGDYNGTGVAGRTVTGKNGNSIFLPAAGGRDGSGLYNAGSYGYYWSGSLVAGGPGSAWYVRFYSDYVDRDGYRRYDGRSVRPVLP